MEDGGWRMDTYDGIGCLIPGLPEPWQEGAGVRDQEVRSGSRGGEGGEAGEEQQLLFLALSLQQHW